MLHFWTTYFLSKTLFKGIYWSIKIYPCFATGNFAFMHWVDINSRSKCFRGFHLACFLRPSQLPGWLAVAILAENFAINERLTMIDKNRITDFYTWGVERESERIVLSTSAKFQLALLHTCGKSCHQTTFKSGLKLGPPSSWKGAAQQSPLTWPSKQTFDNPEKWTCSRALI